MPAPPSPLRRGSSSSTSPWNARCRRRRGTASTPAGIRTTSASGSAPPPRRRPGCAAVANILGLPDVAVEVITPDVGGGFGTKVCTPIPRRSWSRGRRHVGTRGQVGGGPLRALRVGHPRTGPGAPRARRVRRRRHHPRPGGGVLARHRCVHALRHRAADHHRHPASRPVSPPPLPGHVHVALHQHGDLHAVPGAGRPWGCFVMERTMDRIAEEPRARPCGGAGATSSGPTSSPTTST